MKEAQIIIYAILEHFDKAVKLALECKEIKFVRDRYRNEPLSPVELAKRYADKPPDDDDGQKLRKKLWMKIAKYLFNY